MLAQRRICLILIVLSLGACKGAQQQQDPWNKYALAVDDMVTSYVQFNEPDTAKQRAILDDYARAKRIRDEYHRTGQIPDDPIVYPIDAGEPRFTPANTHVSLILADDPAIECHALRIDKPAGVSGHFVVVGGNRGFWVDHRTDAKFISAAFTLPGDENFLEIQSRSWSPGKIIIAFLAGATITLSGCDPGNQAATSPSSTTTTTPTPGECETTTDTPKPPGGWVALGEACLHSGAACTGGGQCKTRLTEMNPAASPKTRTYECQCR